MDRNNKLGFAVFVEVLVLAVVLLQVPLNTVNAISVPAGFEDGALISDNPSIEEPILMVEITVDCYATNPDGSHKTITCSGEKRCSGSDWRYDDQGKYRKVIVLVTEALK